MRISFMLQSPELFLGGAARGTLSSISAIIASVTLDDEDIVTGEDFGVDTLQFLRADSTAD
jgi:hypothetical protein